MTTYTPARPVRASQPLPTRFDWMDDAACRGCDPDLWDTDRTPDPTIARTICAGCPAIAACAIAATSLVVDGKRVCATHGIWAGVDMRSPRGYRLLAAAAS